MLEQIGGESRNFKRKCKLFWHQFFQSVKEVFDLKSTAEQPERVLKRMKNPLKLYTLDIECSFSQQ